MTLSDDEALALSPYLTTLKRKGRLAPSRLNDLLKSAKAKQPPTAPDDCCASSCKPCVNELWKQECRVWKECHAEGEEPEEEEEEAVEEDEASVKEKALLEVRRSTPDIVISIEELPLNQLSLKEPSDMKLVDT